VHEIEDLVDQRGLGSERLGSEIGLHRRSPVVEDSRMTSNVRESSMEAGLMTYRACWHIMEPLSSIIALAVIVIVRHCCHCASGNEVKIEWS